MVCQFFVFSDDIDCVFFELFVLLLLLLQLEQQLGQFDLARHHGLTVAVCQFVFQCVAFFPQIVDFVLLGDKSFIESGSFFDCFFFDLSDLLVVLLRYLLLELFLAFLCLFLTQLLQGCLEFLFARFKAACFFFDFFKHSFIYFLEM